MKLTAQRPRQQPQHQWNRIKIKSFFFYLFINYSYYIAYSTGHKVRLDDHYYSIFIFMNNFFFHSSSSSSYIRFCSYFFIDWLVVVVGHPKRENCLAWCAVVFPLAHSCIYVCSAYGRLHCWLHIDTVALFVIGRGIVLMPLLDFRSGAWSIWSVGDWKMNGFTMDNRVECAKAESSCEKFVCKRLFLMQILENREIFFSF